jgi:hypothetical protein
MLEKLIRLLYPILISPLSSEVAMVLFGMFGIVWVALLVLSMKDVWVMKSKFKRWFDWVYLLMASGLLIAFGTAVFNIVAEPILFGEQPLMNVIKFFGFTAAEVGLVSVPLLVSLLSAKVFFKRNLARRFFQALAILPLIWGTVIALFVLAIMQDGSFANRYFKLHAAIKNTCLLDPLRSQCPTKLEELSYIEPLEFKQLAAITDFSYRYDPTTNQYTFIARPTAKTAVVFDQRLIPLYGIDFKEYTVSTWGKDRIKDPPPFDGPWELSEWKRKPKPETD